MNNSILVIGGTGTTGRSLIGLLKNSQANFKAMVRSEDKQAALEASGIPAVQATLGDWEQVERALQGIDTVFLLTSVGPQSVAQQNGLIDRAKAAGVRKIVKISAVGAEVGSKVHLADWHGKIEAHLRESGMEYVILRPHSFMQNAFMSIPTIKSEHTIYQSMGTSRIPMIDTRDIARASYECLTRDDYNNKTFELTGPETIGYAELASAISYATDQEIRYVAIPPEAHNQALKRAHVPDWLADDLTAMSEAWGAKGVSEPSTAYQEITGQNGTTINQFATDHASYFAS